MGKGVLAAAMAVALALSCVGHAWAAELSMQEFGRRVAAEIERQYPGAKAKAKAADQLLVTRANGETVTTNLERTCALYRGSPDELDAIVGDLVRSLDDDQLPVEASRLVILVRAAGYALGGPDEPSGGGMLSKPLPGEMAIIVALDHPESYGFVGAVTLRQELKMDDAAIWARAFANTLPRIDFKPQELPADRVVQISAESGLTSSLVAVDAFWDAPELTRHGPVVVAVDRDSLFVARLSNAEGVAKLRKAMAFVRDDPNSLTDQLLVRRNGRWEVLH